MQKNVPSYEFRRRAREAMKPVMSVLIVVALIATLPSLISSAVTLMTSADPAELVNSLANRLMQVMEKYGVNQAEIAGGQLPDAAGMQADIAAVYELYIKDCETFLVTKGPIILALTLMVLIISPVMTLGMINALLHALRRQEFTAGIALSRTKYLFKALGLELMLALKLFLWAMPGTLLMLAGMFLPQTLMAVTIIAGLVLMLVLVVRVSYRYAMVVYILADAPQTGIRECFRRSGELMKRRKMELFMLELSFIGWNLLLSYVQLMLNGFGMVIGLTLGMFASLFLTVYTNCAKAAFYQEYAVGPLPEAKAEPEVEDLV